MRKGAVAKIVAESGNLYTFDIAFCNVQRGLGRAKAFHHYTGEVVDACTGLSASYGEKAGENRT